MKEAMFPHIHVNYFFKLGHLVGSALSDPYLSLSAAINGLAGPLHGLATQEVLMFLRGLKNDLKGEKPTKENLTKLIWDLLNSGRVIPGIKI